MHKAPRGARPRDLGRPDPFDFRTFRTVRAFPTRQKPKISATPRHLLGHGPSNPASAVELIRPWVARRRSTRHEGFHGSFLAYLRAQSALCCRRHRNPPTTVITGPQRPPRSDADSSTPSWA